MSKNNEYTVSSSESCTGNYVYVYPQRGWECPRCHRILSPYVQSCPCSNVPDFVPYQPYIPVSPNIPSYPTFPDGTIIWNVTYNNT